MLAKCYPLLAAFGELTLKLVAEVRRRQLSGFHINDF
jgi:hypothetical protein